VLPNHLLRELRYLEVYTARKMPHLRAGAYTSRRRGPGFDFDQHRAYRPGDDVRRIDWNVTARLGVPFVRETHAERELDLTIAIDVSRSMAFGTARYSKKEVTLLVAGSLLFSALADQINTGFLAFGDRVLRYRPPRRTRARAWNLLEELWSLEGSGDRTAILPTVRYLGGHLKKAGMIFLVSDFLTDEDLFGSGELEVLAARHDVVAVVVGDPAEATLPPGSAVIDVRDVESGAEARVALGAALRQSHAERMRSRSERLTDGFYGVPMDHVRVRSDRHVVESLLDLFAARRRA
jgi:uncharacterized protein (DUF58 family)